jgi:parallel beta-helix repeat protein
MKIRLLLLYALFRVTAHAQEIVVAPDESIQAAIEELGATGGCVTLRPGVYKIDRSIVLHSNITLQGDPSVHSDRITIIPQNEDMDAALLTNTKPITNVTIRNLSIRGNVKDGEQNYPDSYHKNPKGRVRKGILGILFTAEGESYESAENRDITIDSVEVSHCSMGIHIKGTRDLSLTNLDIHHNGMVRKYFHNVYLRRVFKARIADSTFYDSPTGCGLNISQSGDITLTNCSAHTNYWRGMRIYGEQGWVIENISVTGNSCTGNGDVGFMFFNIKGGVVSHNKASQNRASNVKSGGTKNLAFKDNTF